jgi:hypothetical protein
VGASTSEIVHPVVSVFLIITREILERDGTEKRGRLTSSLFQYQPHVSRSDDSHIDQSQNTSREERQTSE